MVKKKPLSSLYSYLDSRNLNYKYVLFFTAASLLVSYLGILFIDVFNFFGLRNLFSNYTVPFFWDFVFREGSVVEVLQWSFLFLFVIFSFFLSERMKENDKGRVFWLLFGFAGIFMLAEDALNIRHVLIRNPYFPWYTQNIIETLYFGLLGVLPVLAVVKYRKPVFKDVTTKKILIFAFIFYSSAALLSGPVELTDIDTEIGNSFHSLFSSLGGEDYIESYEEGVRRIEEREKEYSMVLMDMPTRFTDYVVEESLELIGATLLFTSALSFKQFTEL